MLFDLLVEVLTLVLEIKKVRHIPDDIVQLETKVGTTATLKKFVDRLLVIEAKDAKLLESIGYRFIDVLEQAEFLVFLLFVLNRTHPNFYLSLRSLLNSACSPYHIVQVRQVRLEDACEVTHQFLR